MSRDKSKLVPIVEMLADALVLNAKSAGYQIKITDCFRTKEEQNSLSSSVTKVKYPYSLHCYGLAFDICQKSSSNPYPNDAKWWETVGEIGERLGLEWGGRWTGFVDRPHFQLSTWGSTGKEVYSRLVLPTNFIKANIWKIDKLRKMEYTKDSSMHDIMMLQTALNICGCECEIDGCYGEETKHAFYTFRMMYDGKYCKAGSITKTGAGLLADKMTEILNR